VNNRYDASVSLIRLKKVESFLEHEIIFIKRSICDNDPWSGHCALPGGGLAKYDTTLHETAIRETKEEIGLYLTASNYKSFVCTIIPNKKFNKRDLNLHCYEFETEKLPSFFDITEVSDIFMVKVEEFFEEKNYKFLEMFSDGQKSLCFIFKENYCIWGLTLAIIFEYLIKVDPERTEMLSFYPQYQKRKNKALQVILDENISNDRN
jgi:8-oxo-dGTP pyrophosphatase MutT (NUDIX family)